MPLKPMPQVSKNGTKIMILRTKKSGATAGNPLVFALLMETDFA